jgi:hypothetical protein
VPDRDAAPTVRAVHRIDMMIVSNSFLAALTNVNGVLVLVFPQIKYR